MSGVRRLLRVPGEVSSAAVRHMQRSQGVLILLTTLACWSSVPLFLKHLSGYLDHWTNNGWRYGASALFWMPAVVWAVARGRLPRAIWTAALGPAAVNAASQVAFTAAHSDVSPGIVTFGLRLQLVFVAVGAYLLFPGERATIRSARYLAGLALLIGGIGVVLFGGEVDLHGASLRGVLLSVASGLGYGVYGLSVRRFMYGFHPIYAFGVIAMYTAAALVVGMLCFGHNHGMDVLELQSRELWELGLSAFLGIALGHVLYYASIDRLGVAATAGVLQLQPFIVSVAAMGIFGDRLHAMQWGGGVVAVAGAGLVLAAQKAAERRARA